MREMRLSSEISECQICKQKNQDKMFNIKHIYEKINANGILDDAENGSSGNKANGEKVYFEVPHTISQLSIPPIMTFVLSNGSSSEDSDKSPEYYLNNEDIMFETDLKSSISSRTKKSTSYTIDGMTEDVLDKIKDGDLYLRTLHDLSMSSSVIGDVSDYKTAVIPNDTGRSQSLEQSKKRKIGCDKEEQSSSIFSV